MMTTSTQEAQERLVAAQAAAERAREELEAATREVRAATAQAKQLGISPAQRLALDAMRLASFNDFDGEAVADSLEANRNLWTAALMPTSSYTLRDLPDDWHVDTLLITCPTHNSEQCAALEKLARQWSADEVDWLEEKERKEVLGYGSEAKELAVLRVWWD